MNIIDETGSYWYLDGTLIYHREDGPAAEYKNGTKYWFKKGKCHREDGPAAEFNNGETRWWLNNIHYSFDDWLEKTPISLEEKVLLKLRYG